MNNSDPIVPEKAILGLFSGEIDENPFPIFAQMRKMESVISIPFPMDGTDRQAWMVTRMEEAMQVLKDHAHFTVDGSSIDGNSDIRQIYRQKRGE